MKEICGVSHNKVYLKADDGEMVPMVELIINRSEPVFEHTDDSGSGLVKKRKVTTVRLFASEQAIGQLIGQLEEIKEDLGDRGRLD